MEWSKAKIAGVVSAGVLLAAAAAIIVSAFKAHAEREKDFIAYAVQHRSLTQKLFRLKVNESELRHQMVGVWEMAATKSWGATEVTHIPKGNRRYKIFTPTNWSLVQYDSDSNSVLLASGPYTLHSNLYTETIETANDGMAKYRGARPRFHIRVDGDKYYQIGYRNNPPIEEMWQRVWE
jgi:glucose dehydrogenase